jgi:uncharacterized membrane protein
LAVPEEAWLRTILGLPVILIFPGYLMCISLWPKKGDMESTWSLVALSIGLSVAVTVFSLLVMDWAMNLSEAAVLGTTYGIVLALSGLAAFRRQTAIGKGGEPFTIAEAFGRDGAVSLREPTTIAATVVVAISLVLVGWLVMNPPASEGYTEFYLLDSAGGTSNYPKNMTAGTTASVTVGVDCQENNTAHYTLLIGLSEYGPGAPANSTVYITGSSGLASPLLLANGTAFSYNFSADPGELNEIHVSFAIDSAGDHTVYFVIVNGTEATELHLRVRVV